MKLLKLTNPKLMTAVILVLGLFICMTVFIHLAKSPTVIHLHRNEEQLPLKRNIVTAVQGPSQYNQGDNGKRSVIKIRKKKGKSKVKMEIQESNKGIQREDIIFGNLVGKYEDKEDKDYDVLGNMLMAERKKEEDIENDKDMNDIDDDLDWLKYPKTTTYKEMPAAGASKETLRQNSTCAFILDEMHIRHCITSDILGNVPEGLQLEPIKDVYSDTNEDTEVRKNSFQKVFDTRGWGHSWDIAYRDLNASGMGATLYWSQETQAALHVIINQVKMVLRKERITMLDIPCGDMQWMSRFLMTRDDVEYTGMDIVPNLIAHHRKSYKDRPWNFRAADILRVGLQDRYDLIFNRMMLQHLYNKDVVQLLREFSESGSSYLLSTSFSGHPVNEELVILNNPGRFRKLNLEIPPISLSPPICLTRDGPGVGINGWEHFLGLWKLPLYSVANCIKPSALQLKGTPRTIYSCIKWSSVGHHDDNKV